MTTDSQNLNLKVWSTIHQTHDILRNCEDRLFREFGLTTEHYLTLVAIKALSHPARVTDISRLTRRSVNSVSMIIDRMVKAGLVRRARDRKDRRTVFVTATAEAEGLLEPASKAGQDFIDGILASKPDDGKRFLIKLLEVLQSEAQTLLEGRW